MKRMGRKKSRKWRRKEMEKLGVGGEVQNENKIQTNDRHEEEQNCTSN